ncbi:MAG: response regulator receiver protein [Ponticaulis sp.]|nr:response regulator receiver protein [Ponticaulis sp.]
MSKHDLHPEALADRKAGRLAWGVAVLMTIASWIVLSSSVQTDMARMGQSVGLEAWVREGASHVATLFAIAVIPLALNRFPVTPQNWKRTIPLHILNSLIFSGIHLALMILFRVIAYPALLGYAYETDYSFEAFWLYEYRKDAYSYVLLTLAFAICRSLEQSKLEVAAAKADAKRDGRLTLKCGGRTILINTGDVIHASAASNYVEVTTPHSTHLARLTLSGLETLLQAAGTSHIRVHRSHIVNSDRIREITPIGDGNVSIELDNGIVVPGSRNYRSQLPDAA